MHRENTRRGFTQQNYSQNNGHSRMSLLGIYDACSYVRQQHAACVEDPRTLRTASSSGMTTYLNVGQTRPDNQTKCHSKLDLESHRTLLRNNEILKQVQDDNMMRMPCGFTLIELLVVVLIIGILAAVALPQYQKAVEKSRAIQLYTLLSSVAQAQQLYRLANGEYTGDFSKLDIDFPYESGDETGGSFTGGDYTWSKCSNNSCLYGWRSYQDGRYGLEVSFNTGDFLCIAEKNTKAVNLCQTLGFTKFTHPGGAFDDKGYYYTRP